MDGEAPLAAELVPVSTGPRTLAGKVASSMNATRHGLQARSVVLPGIESPEAWEAHRADVVSSLAPVGAASVALAERAAELLWRLGRAGAAESALATFELAGAEERAVRETVKSALADEEAFALASAPFADPPTMFRPTPSILMARTLDDLRGLGDGTLLREAERRIARAKGMAAVGPEVEQVRRHEAHLQRQLAGVLAMMAALVTPRAMFVRAMAERTVPR